METGGLFNWLSCRWTLLLTIGIGHLSYTAFNWLYDQVLYVFIVYHLGFFLGGALMTTGSILQCAALLLAYQRIRIEWVGAAAIHSLADKTRPSFMERILLWAMRRGQLPIFLALCVYQDPFITTAYFKKGRFDALTAKDWSIFSASVVVSNGYWTLRSGLVAQILVRASHDIYGGL